MERILLKPSTLGYLRILKRVHIDSAFIDSRSIERTDLEAHFSTAGTLDIVFPQIANCGKSADHKNQTILNYKSNVLRVLLLDVCRVRNGTLYTITYKYIAKRATN